MADAQPPPRAVQIPRSFLADMPAATMNVGLALMSRRSNAIADFWRTLAEVRQPTELMAVQLNYLTHMVDDYQEAFSEGLSQLSAQASGPGQAARAAPAQVRSA